MKWEDMFKSAAQIKKEQEAYEKWAFPQGEARKKKLQEIIAALFPSMNGPIAMAAYLDGREVYEKAEEESRILETLSRLHAFLQGRKDRENIFLFAALIMADQQVTDELAYPPVEQIRKKAEELRKEYGPRTQGW